MLARLWLLPGIAIGAAIGLLLSGALPPSGARVVGGIIQCAAFSHAHVPGEPRYNSGYVELLKGDVVRSPDPADPMVIRDVLPTEVVATRSVGLDEKYSFDIPPGHYVLYAPVAPAGSPSNAFRYVPLVLKQGDNVRVDIPNTCI